MSSFSKQYISACCPHLVSSEVACVYDEIHSTFKSLDLVHAEDVRTIARDMFPSVREGRLADFSPKNVPRLNKFRMEEAISDLKAAKFWLSTVRNPSDTVGMAMRDIGIIVEQLQGVE